MKRLEKALDAQHERDKLEQHRQEQAASAAQTEMQHAQTLADRVEAYRKALRADPRIARLQILDMNRPLNITAIYIRLRLHEETRPGYDLEPMREDVGTRHDPNVLLKAGDYAWSSDPVRPLLRKKHFASTRAV